MNFAHENSDCCPSPIKLDESKSIHSTDSIATENSGTHGRPIWVHSSQVGKADSKWVCHEPETVEDDNGYHRMNIDKGNQANGGESAVVLGNVAHPEVVNREYRIKTLDNVDLPLSVSADSEGWVWLIVGTDSGFEGLSAFYYARISYTLSIVEPPNTGGYRPPVWAVALVAGIGAGPGGSGAICAASTNATLEVTSIGV